MRSYKTFGTGPNKVLMFPGLVGTSNAFDRMLEFANADAFQYVVPNLRGYGESLCEPGLYTLREAVVDAVRLVEHLGWTEFSVAGHSLGALLAQMVAVALPTRVRSIVMIAGLSAKGASSDPARANFMKEAARSIEGREALVNAGTGKRYSDAAVRRIAKESFSSILPSAFESYAMDSARTDISQAVNGSACPILVLVGAHDPNASEKAARETTLLFYRHAILTVLEGSGHYPMHEVPLATMAELEMFVRMAVGK